jgi:hypothetical protein
LSVRVRPRAPSFRKPSAIAGGFFVGATVLIAEGAHSGASAANI